MIAWGECSIEWADAETIGKITHLPTGIYIEPNIKCDGTPDANGVVARQDALKALNAKVEAAKSVK